MVVSNNNGTYNLLGLSPNEYRLLKQLIESYSASNHTFEDNEEPILKSLCEKIGCKYVNPISSSEWEDIESISIK
jgi:hypothetical protein